MAKTNANKVENILLDLVQTQVEDQFGLDNNYAVVSFNAKNLSIALSSKDYDVTIKCKGEVSNDIVQNYMATKRELEQEIEE